MLINKKLKTFYGPLLLAMALLFTAGCQDHHFVPYDKMGPLPEPGSEVTTNGLMGGTINIENSLANNDYKSWTLYVIVRAAGEKIPLAAIKRGGITFPYQFTITQKDLMMGEPSPNVKYVVDARLDRDGNIDSKEPDDLMGRAYGQFNIGSTNADLTLNKEKG